MILWTFFDTTTTKGNTMKESTTQDIIVYGSWAIEAIAIGAMLWYVHHIDY